MCRVRRVWSRVAITWPRWAKHVTLEGGVLSLRPKSFIRMQGGTAVAKGLKAIKLDAQRETVTSTTEGEGVRGEGKEEELCDF